MTTIAKSVLNEKRKWSTFNLDLYHINEKIFNCYRKISSGDYDDKKSILQSCII